METITERINQVEAISNMFLFICKYRQMEKAPLDTGYQLIRKIADQNIFNHLCSNWKGKKKDFGSFYLNLGYKHRCAIHEAFGIIDKSDEDYLQRIDWNSRSIAFNNPTGFLLTAKNVMLFFNNHGIDTDPIGDGSLMLTNLPAMKKRYGNSANWGDYVDSLVITEAVRVLEAINNHMAK